MDSFIYYLGFLYFFLKLIFMIFYILMFCKLIKIFIIDLYIECNFFFKGKEVIFFFLKNYREVCVFLELRKY